MTTSSKARRSSIGMSLSIRSQRRGVQIRLNLAKQETSLLDHLSYSIMGEFNRSLTARCIVGYFNKSGDKKLHEE